MTFGRKNTPWGFWIVVAACALPLLYVASVGPVVWIWSWSGSPDAPGEMLERFYIPLFFAVDACPQPVENAFQWYIELFAT